MTSQSKPQTGDKAEVILIHGLWYGSWTLKALSRRLLLDGFRVRHFAYPATATSLEVHANKLHEFAGSLNTDGVHFLGHSLGGLVILRMMSENPDLPPGRIVLLGSPLGGSVVARRMRKLPGSEKLLGQARPAIESGFARIPEDRQTGLIAGSMGVGLGVLMGGTGGPGDGTVSLEEASCPGLHARMVLPVSHTGMLYSAKVASHAANFLETGQF